MSTLAIRPRRRVPWARLLATPLSLAIGALAWEIVGQAASVRFFPPLSAVLARLAEMVGNGQILANLGDSLVNLVLGFGISLVGGLVIGAAMGRYRKVEAALGVYVYALLTAPSLVFAPIFFSLLGEGRASIVAVVVTYAMFVIVINTASAMRSVPGHLIEMARSYGASEWQILTRIMLPAATPMIMAGVRLGVGRAVIGMINGEMFIAVVGLGRVVTQAGGRFDGAGVLAVLLVIIAVALAAVGLVQAVDRRLTRWVPQTSKGKS
ncbi:ABC transporter permease [Stackebrandtia nassauensis]|uniref:Binding-protein-dependent transport systems inner membrane component n=1 Tax=Stackebrandtia nassauensis (strain DSM 44728 / CIP 108903 / NRRL B-16338 / NBRC 102104 / LLR-40K-21) TaxID=446470 RepID=D3PX11_STANL|nr:ABC transporter permease [Stackebrandtia nassauensis]ADD45235.1 binding-protein-dependent transport systems inner membrane component [Stackebrandtia nassauensis DSM 44728]